MAQGVQLCDSLFWLSVRQRKRDDNQVLKESSNRRPDCWVRTGFGEGLRKLQIADSAVIEPYVSIVALLLLGWSLGMLRVGSR